MRLVKTTRFSIMLRAILTSNMKKQIFLDSNRVLSIEASSLKTTYVHPLSQIVLEHLQRSDDWLERMGLDMSVLDLKKDGTFNLVFPQNEGRIWLVYILLFISMRVLFSIL